MEWGQIELFGISKKSINVTKLFRIPLNIIDSNNYFLTYRKMTKSNTACIGAKLQRHNFSFQRQNLRKVFDSWRCEFFRLAVVLMLGVFCRGAPFIALSMKDRLNSARVSSISWPLKATNDNHNWCRIINKFSLSTTT